ncbi:glycosyltransferase family protein [Mucilaginibacter myungsuensis]|uniref:Nucleotidyltransferase n=1 Tax=Mucilaginibacter myungsuensis TaxID=649104 RepID=A0A929KXM0_9SPHI|nr:nucleotidyltransferase [Mucilaginibacter myungsuensis]MBE9662380.1 nucleotidyltransferase [Mucilaginibacter myungsuensis]MDN3599183.1 hypothetical protein [Mucilaginibacter myungsuensis]
MAGKGERFAKEGYTLPKPILPVDGVPMVVKAALDLPKADRYLYVMLREHTEVYKIHEVIGQYIPDSDFVILDQVTEGQASTCLLAMEHIDEQTDIMIGACDNGLIYDRDKFAGLKSKADVIVCSFRHNATVVTKPKQYGWVAVDGDDVNHVSVKKPISADPFNDHAVVGAFWFRNKDVYMRSVDRMIDQDRRINNEFYIDECINDAVALGYKVKILEVDKYICWGTPNDYETYNYWKSYFEKY